MKHVLTDKEIAALACLQEAKEPVGSWSLVNKIGAKGLHVSSATIGRILSNLEHFGYAKKCGNSGRIITDDGINALSSNRLRQTLKEEAEQLEQTIATTVLEDFLLVLQARKVIECETARLAAQNAEASELDSMMAMLDEQKHKHERNESIADMDMDFHLAIARASRNKVLEALYVMLFSYGQHTPIIEYIRKHVDTVYTTSHLQILEAIRARDNERAEACMAAHMDSLMRDVREFWDMFYDG